MTTDEFSDYGRLQIIDLMERLGATREQAQQLVEGEAEKLDRALGKLAEHPYNLAVSGGPRAVVGRSHFRMRKAITAAISITSSLAAAGVGLVGWPPLGVIGAAATVATAIDQLSDLVTQMSEDEFAVYETILQIVDQDKAGRRTGATAEEVKQFFLKNGEAPFPDLPGILSRLEISHVVSGENAGSSRVYSIVY